jgi:hypothetical protein
MEPEKAEDDGWETIDPMDDSVDHNGNPIADDEPESDAAPSDYTKREQEHYAAIVALNVRVEVAHNEWTMAKEEAKDRKTAYDALAGMLVDLIKRGPDPQKTLDFAGSESAGDDEGDLTLFSPDTEPEWRSRPIEALGMSAAMNRRLDEGGIGTLGDLADFWRDENRALTELAGIGAEKAATIADVWATYTAAHREVYGMIETQQGDDEATEGTEGE